MESRIAAALHTPIPPIATLLSDEAPPGALQFAEGRWGCVMGLAASAFKGRAAVADARTFGCLGGGTGLGFGNPYAGWPGGVECFHAFLSDGNERTEHGRATADRVRGTMRPLSFDHFVHGEGYLKDPATAKRFVDALPITQVGGRYVVFQPLAQVDPAGTAPVAVHFLVDPDRLSALVVLANHSGPDNERVIVPFAAGCQSLGILTMREAASPNPRAVLGLVDLSAREAINRPFGRDKMTMSIPWTMFLRMEADVPGSFLEKGTWLGLRDAADRGEPGSAG